MMNNSTRAIIAAAVLALLAVACGNGASSTRSGGSAAAGGSSSSQSALAFSRCMRTNGVPNYPDPDSSGALRKGAPEQFGVSTSQFQSAQTACQHLLQDGGTLQQCEVAGACSQAQMQQMMTDDLAFARCMRSHGVPNWPDPTETGGRVVFSLSGTGIDHHSTQIEARMNECEPVAPNAVLGFA
ncbi:MAG: hypothetical protein E6J41_29590 [Chloroflexi bacterium]|nr:MAG: hypothetical protein E6J41_29590 [Chloroflexota bacterium]